MSEVPDAVEIERVWLVEVPYTPEAADRRPPLRPAHLARIADLIADGTVIEAGGTLDLGNAVLLVRAATEADVLAMIERDVYTDGGVWHSPRVRAFGRVVSSKAAAR
jgi:uncharacterized protein YciI